MTAQALLAAIVCLSYYGNQGGRLFFGLQDFLGVGILLNDPKNCTGFSYYPKMNVMYCCVYTILNQVTHSEWQIISNWDNAKDDENSSQVGVTVGFAIIFPLVLLTYLAEGNILVFVSSQSYLKPTNDIVDIRYHHIHYTFLYRCPLNMLAMDNVISLLYSLTRPSCL